MGSKEATTTNNKDDKKHLTWTHQQEGEIELEYAGCVFATSYGGLEYGNSPLRNIAGDTINAGEAGDKNTLRFKDYELRIPNRLGRTDIWVNQSMSGQAMCPQGKDVGVGRPSLIYDMKEGNKLIGTNHTYHVPNAGILRLT